MFNKRPTCIISFCFMCPEAKTIAFGGVATGSIKAQEAAVAISTESTPSGTPKTSATLENTGISNAALAVLLANSVKKTTKPVIVKRIIIMPRGEIKLPR